jgi:hypothetical protein
MQVKEYNEIENAQTVNVVFVFVLLKLFFYELGKNITAFDILFAGVVLTRFISYALHDDKLLLSLTSFIASFFSFLLCVDGQFVMPAVVSFMLLSLTGSCFLYSTSMIDNLDATPMVSLACIICGSSSTSFVSKWQGGRKRVKKQNMVARVFCGTKRRRRVRALRRTLRCFIDYGKCASGEYDDAHLRECIMCR